MKRKACPVDGLGLGILRRSRLRLLLRSTSSIHGVVRRDDEIVLHRIFILLG
jgi:hypothetical protein